MNHVSGPFILYECSKCGHYPVKESAPRNPDRLAERIAEANNKPETRRCASCGTDN